MNFKFKASVLAIFILGQTNAFAANGVAKHDKLNLSGTYDCTAYDSNEGIIHEPTTYTFDERASDSEHNFGAYQFKSKDYNGMIAAQGTQFGYYFENNDKKDPVALTDRGVGIA